MHNALCVYDTSIYLFITILYNTTWYFNRRFRIRKKAEMVDGERERGSSSSSSLMIYKKCVGLELAMIPGALNTQARAARGWVIPAAKIQAESEPSRAPAPLLSRPVAKRSHSTFMCSSNKNCCGCLMTFLLLLVVKTDKTTIFLARVS